MIISFIGMSGAGKSHWSQHLTDHGYHRICIDDEIELKLDDKLKEFGYKGINDVAKWLGEPYAPQFKQNEQIYLDHENEAMQAALDYIQQHPDQDIVIDTTGSVIYLGDDITSQLKNLTTIINFDTPQSVKEQMFKLYIEDPKPVIWGDSYQPSKGRTPAETLKICYPELLDYRSKQYHKLAHRSLDFDQVRDPEFTSQNLLEVINSVSNL